MSSVVPEVNLGSLYRKLRLIRRAEEEIARIYPSDKIKSPVHLSIGQEASAVGQAFLLDIDDHIFGSHRSHGEILAKGLSAIEKLDDDTLMSIMKGYNDGLTLTLVYPLVLDHAEGEPYVVYFSGPTVTPTPTATGVPG